MVQGNKVPVPGHSGSAFRRSRAGNWCRGMLSPSSLRPGFARETARMAVAAKEGRLERTYQSKGQFRGRYLERAKELNGMLDAILLPIGEGNPHSSQIGKIDELIVQTYQGDHEKMKLTVNNVADRCKA